MCQHHFEIGIDLKFTLAIGCLHHKRLILWNILINEHENNS